MTIADSLKPSLGLFAPSGYLEASVLELAQACICERGWQVRTAPHVLDRTMRFAGTDAHRLEDLHEAACAPGLDAALCVRGGYGLTRLLDRIDFDRIASVGRPLVGYSDFTAFNLALLARTGACSFQGPAASDFWRPGDRPDADDALKSAVRLNQEDFFRALQSETVDIDFEPVLHGELTGDLHVEGTLWGGNLAMICSLIGTPFLPSVRQGILFLEDVNEPAYRIERMLMQLWHAGVLEHQSAVVFGDFSSMPVLGNDGGYGFAQAVAAVRDRCPVPMIGGLPFGHARRRVTLGVGAAASLVCRRSGGAAAALACLTYRGHPRISRSGCAR